MTDKARDRREQDWSWFDNKVIRQYGPEIGPFGIAAYMALLTFANSRDQTCFPSHQQISDATGMSRRMVMMAIDRLVKAGLIKRTHRKDGQVKTSNLYTILTPGGGSAGGALLVQEVHQGSAPHALGVVQEVHQGSAPHAHKPDEFNQTNLNQTNLTTPPSPSSGEDAHAGDDQPTWRRSWKASKRFPANFPQTPPAWFMAHFDGSGVDVAHQWLYMLDHTFASPRTEFFMVARKWMENEQQRAQPRASPTHNGRAPRYRPMTEAEREYSNNWEVREAEERKRDEEIDRQWMAERAAQKQSTAS